MSWKYPRAPVPTQDLSANRLLLALIVGTLRPPQRPREHGVTGEKHTIPTVARGPGGVTGQARRLDLQSPDLRFPPIANLVRNQMALPA